MSGANKVPSSSYGVLRRSDIVTSLEETAEQLQRVGYAVIDSVFTVAERAAIATNFDEIHDIYIQNYGSEALAEIDEHNTIRAALTLPGSQMGQLALNSHLIDNVSGILEGRFILNQQNGVINPPKTSYNQGSWHRDFPYQHFISDQPLGINALYCVDDFTIENGATFVLPGSQKVGAFPSVEYIQRHAVQLEAPAGSYILMDCMLYHAGGPNSTLEPRRAVNQVFNIPFFKQQINLANNLKRQEYSQREQEILGFHLQEPASVSAYLASRKV
jgi:hypothetical protein